MCNLATLLNLFRRSVFLKASNKSSVQRYKLFSEKIAAGGLTKYCQTKVSKLNIFRPKELYYKVCNESSEHVKIGIVYLKNMPKQILVKQETSIDSSGE